MSRDRTISLLTLAVVVLVTAGFTPVALSAEDEKASAAVPAEIPKEWKTHANPRPADDESLANGKLLFSSQCAMCHGATGDGKGALATRLKLSTPDFTKKSTRTDGEWFYILTHGHGKMPAEGDRLSDETKWDLVNYVRGFSAAE